MPEQQLPLILASASIGRRYLLEQAGYQFTIHPSNIDEPTDAGYPDARHLVQHISWLKAAAVAPQFNEGIVLSADTVAWIDGEPIGKPDDEAHARQILTKLGGREHELWTGVCLWRRPDNLQLIFQEVSKVLLKKMSDEELDQYILSRQWANNSGAYAIKETNDPHVTVTQGSLSNVIGLPMESLEELLPQLHRLDGANS